MKTSNGFGATHALKLPILIVFMLITSLVSYSQMNCDGVTEMYGMWNNFTALRNQVRPINFTTGAIGNRIGSQTFNIPYTDINSPASGYYGSTTLSASATSNRFYYMNRDYQRKSVWIMNGTTGARNTLENLTQAAISSNWFVKLAVGIDNRNYSLATPVKVSGNRYLTMPTKMIRFPALTCTGNDCGNGQVVDMGSIQGSLNFWAAHQYNGDIAFSNNGDMYLFGSELDTVTFKYTHSRIYRITAANIPATPNAANVIPIEFITDINGLGPSVGADSVTITGAAFDLAGNFYISANDTSANWEGSYLYRGSSIGGVYSSVTKINTFAPIPSGYKITDLASCTYPNIQVLSNSAFRLTAEKKGVTADLVWVDKTSIGARYYILERKLDNETVYKEIATVDASAIGPDEKFVYNDASLPSGYQTSLYRIKAILLNGTYTYSNTTKLNGSSVNNNVRVVNNPFTNSIQLEINAARSGKMDVVIYTESGIVMTRKTILNNKGKNIQTITGLGHLKTGVYILKMSNEMEQYTTRLVRQ